MSRFLRASPYYFQNPSKRGLASVSGLFRSKFTKEGGFLSQSFGMANYDRSGSCWWYCRGWGRDCDFFWIETIKHLSSFPSRFLQKIAVSLSSNRHQVPMCRRNHVTYCMCLLNLWYGPLYKRQGMPKKLDGRGSARGVSAFMPGARNLTKKGNTEMRQAPLRVY